MNLISCTTWECINSFANWISAIGTIVITSLALRLSIKDRIINLKVNLGLGMTNGDNPNVLDRKIFIINYINIGARNVTVTNHYWIFPFDKGKSMLMPHLSREIGHLCTRMPVTLKDGESASTFYLIDFFNNGLDNPEKFFFKKEKISAFFRIFLFKLQVSTSVGKNIKAKIDFSVRKELWRQYNEIYG